MVDFEVGAHGSELVVLERGSDSLVPDPLTGQRRVGPVQIVPSSQICDEKKAHCLAFFAWEKKKKTV